jgi:hypothetical protein
MTNYYVADAAGGGDDGNSGLSELLPWLTISHAQGVLTGDRHDVSLLFKRGCTWREQFTAGAYGTSGHPFTISSYSTGAQPKILGSINKDSDGDWTVEGNLAYWTYSTVPNEAYRDGIYLHDVALKTSVTDTTTFWVDVGNSRIYVWGGGSAPTVGGHTFEFPQRTNAIYATGKDYVTLDGLDCRYTKGEGIHLDTGSDHCTVTSSKVFGTHYSGIQSKNSTYFTATYNDVSYVGLYHTANTGDPTYLLCGIMILNSAVVDGHNQIAYNYVHHTGRSCISIYDKGCSYTTIEYNHVHDPGQSIQTADGLKSHAIGIQIYNSADYVNFLHHVVTRYNYVPFVAQHSIELRNQVDNIDIHGNLFGQAFNNDAGMNSDWLANIMLNNNEGAMVQTNVRIYNNVCYQPAGASKTYCANLRIVHLGTSLDVSGMLVRNNIFYNANLTSGSKTYYNSEVSVTPPTLDRNCHYSALGGSFLQVENVAKTWAGRPAGFEDHGLNADPLFTNAAGGDFTLQAGSPCIDVGADLGATYKDALMHDSVWPAGVVLGDQGTHGAGWEIGAYIYESPTVWMTAQLSAGGS